MNLKEYLDMGIWVKNQSKSSGFAIFEDISNINKWFRENEYYHFLASSSNQFNEVLLKERAMKKVLRKYGKCFTYDMETLEVEI